MAFLVPFDGSELSEAALTRAAQFGTLRDERVLAVCVVPKGNADYARGHGWIGPDEPFDASAVVSELHERVVDRCPSANFRHEGASMVFIGSENAGRLVTSLGSVGGTLASDGDYDVVIVRNPTPARIARLREETDRRNPRSDFFLPE